MKKAFRILSLLATGLAVVGCQDFENGFSAQEIKNAEYAAHFEKVFGTPDPNQDWSMATLVKANVNLPGLTGTAKMNICTGDPRNSETRLLAQIMLKDGKGSIDFDAIKGSNEVFVTVEQDNEYKVFNHFHIINGILDINKETSTHVHSVVTRVGVGNVTEQGEFSSTCPAELGAEVVVANVTFDKEQNTEGHPTLQYLTGVEQVPAATWSIGLGFNLFGDGKVFAESVEYWNADKMAYYGETNLETMEKGLELITDGVHPIDVPYMFGCTDYANQFGYVYWKDGEDPLTKKHFVLMEDARPGTNVYFGSWKGTSVGAKDLGQKLGTGSEIEQAEEYKDTPMEDWCHCNKGDGIWSEPFGTGAQLPTPPHDDYCTSLPHCYCGIGVDKPQSEHQSYCPMSKDPGPCNCSVASFNPNGSEGDGIYSSAMAHKEGCVDPMQTYFNASNEQIYGTSYRLMYFGDDGNATTGDYIFPAGYHIVFWIDKLGSVEDLTAHTGYAESNFNYSIPELNERLGHTSPANGKKRTGGPAGIVKCITWTLDGVTYMGFGDNSGDEDLNDLVFIVKGATPKNTVQLANIKWHINYNGSHDETDSDLYDRYSLGIDKVYTQPDGTPVNANKEFLGWSTTPTGATGYSKTISETAVAGTTCYYAIWADGKVNIKWHMNLNKTHDTTDGDLHYSQKVTPGDEYTKPTNDPTYEGREFLGWATTPEATTPNVFTGVNMNVTATDEDVCYYAVWSTLTPGSDPEWVSWIFACEDLGGTFDYDFNDVVWEVRKDGVSGKVQARLLAAGGTLPFTLQYNSNKICTKAEVYGENNVSTVYETQGSDWFDVLTDKEWTISANSDKFTILVDGETSTVITGPTTGTPNNKEASKTPEVILVPGDWAWPTEGTCIKEAYEGFTNWTFSANMTGWTNSKQEGKTVSRSATHN